MPNATALLTCVRPDHSEAERRAAELEVAVGIEGFEEGEGWPRADVHGTLFRADAGPLSILTADTRFMLDFQLRVYRDNEGSIVRIGTWEVSPAFGVRPQTVVPPKDHEPADPEQGGPAPSARMAPSAPLIAPEVVDSLTIGEQEPWSDWIVQLWSPPTPAAVAALLTHHLPVVGTVGRFGLHVRLPRPGPRPAPNLPEVRWIEPYHPLIRVQPALLDGTLAGRIIDRVAIHVDPPEALDDVRAVVAGFGVNVSATHRSPLLTDGPAGQLVVALPAERVATVARLPGVAWIGYAPRTPKPESEGEAQIVAGNVRRTALAGASPGAVESGYRRWLHAMDLSGAGATIAICDTGVEWNAGNSRRSAPDLDRRQVAAFDYTNGAVESDTWGHGTHVAGLAVGAGIRDSSRAGAPMSLGLGVAPGASYVTQNAIAEPPQPDQCSWWPTATLRPYTRDASRAGATILTMAWTTDAFYVGQGYVPLAAELDGLVRDPASTGAPGNDLVVVASAGNVPNAGRSTITPPKEAKNIIVVGASTNTVAHVSASDIPLDAGPDGIAPFSARGPALDGRHLPTVVAPGVDVTSTLARTAADPQLTATAVDLRGFAATAPQDREDADYGTLSGTSMSVGLVAGACAILDEWWRAWGDNGPPGAALTRALLVIGADDLSVRLDPAGALDCVRPGPIPDPAQGWGRVNLGNIVCQAPRSLEGVAAERRRGPKRVERGEFHFGDTPHRRRYAKARADLPVRATLAWTDPPGSPGKNPALCNDLDLVVHPDDLTTVWSGNHFRDGWSVPGRSPDTRDTLECVYLEDAPDVVRVSVEPTTLTADARPPFSLHTPFQDYVLVLENLLPVRGEAKAVALLDRSPTMGGSEALVALERGWQGLVRGLRRGDALGLAHFDDVGQVVVPAQPGAPLPELLAPGDADGYCAKVAATTTGGASRLQAGLQAAVAAGDAPVVLLSDGGFGWSRPLLAAWGKRQPVHTVGLWPVAREGVLETVAGTTGGKYLYAPTEALLGAVMAELRAELTGDPVVRSEVVSVGGASPRVTLAIPVESEAEGLHIAITWGDGDVRGVQGPPSDDTSLGIALRTPDGHRLPRWSSVAHVTTGPGSVHLEIGQLRPGRWVVELELRRDTKLDVHIAASVPGVEEARVRLRASLWQDVSGPRPRLRVIARWEGLADLHPSQVSVSGVVERPFALRALNPVHQRDVRKARAVAAPQLRRTLGARRHILRRDGVDIFAPFTEPLDFRWVAHAADGLGPGWEARVATPDLVGTWSAQVCGWVLDHDARRHVRAARASAFVGVASGDLRIREPDAPQGGTPANGPWFRPGEEIDIDASGFVSRDVFCVDGSHKQRTATGGAGHYTAVNRESTRRTVGHLIALGGGPSPFVLQLTSTPPSTPVAVATFTTTSTTTSQSCYPVGRDTWVWAGVASDAWPAAFDLVVGDWNAPAIGSQDWTSEELSNGYFPEPPATSQALQLAPPNNGSAGNRLYKVTLSSGSQKTVVAYVTRDAQTKAVTWYADWMLLNKSMANGQLRGALPFPTNGCLSFDAVSSCDAGSRRWAQLVTSPLPRA